MRRPSALHWMLAAATVVPCLGDGAGSDVIRGDMLARSGTDARGEFVLRDAENRVFQCSYDEQSSFERASERISAGMLARGDRLQVVSDRRPDTGICYARTVDVETTAAVKAPVLRRAAHATYGGVPSDLLTPRGRLTFAGVVLKVSAGELLLRMRANERKTIRLRTDTSYLGGGQALEKRNLQVNTRVYIRAGRDWNDQVEAYQVIWGDMLEPVLPPRIVP